MLKIHKEFIQMKEPEYQNGLVLLVYIMLDNNNLAVTENGKS